MMVLLKQCEEVIEVIAKSVTEDPGNANKEP